MREYRIVKKVHANKLGFVVERFRRFLCFKWWSEEVEELGWNCSDIVFRETPKACQEYIDKQLSQIIWINK